MSGTCCSCTSRMSLIQVIRGWLIVFRSYGKGSASGKGWEGKVKVGKGWLG
jgi:hypothetical protein